MSRVRVAVPWFWRKVLELISAVKLLGVSTYSKSPWDGCWRVSNCCVVTNFLVKQKRPNHMVWATQHWDESGWNQDLCWTLQDFEIDSAMAPVTLLVEIGSRMVMQFHHSGRFTLTRWFESYYENTEQCFAVLFGMWQFDWTWFMQCTYRPLNDKLYILQQRERKDSKILMQWGFSVSLIIWGCALVHKAAASSQRNSGLSREVLQK